MQNCLASDTLYCSLVQLQYKVRGNVLPCTYFEQLLAPLYWFKYFQAEPNDRQEHLLISLFSPITHKKTEFGEIFFNEMYI